MLTKRPVHSPRHDALLENTLPKPDLKILTRPLNFVAHPLAVMACALGSLMSGIGCETSTTEEKVLVPILVTSGGKIDLPTWVKGEEREETRFLLRNLGEGVLVVESAELQSEGLQMKVSPELPAKLLQHQFVTLRFRISPNHEVGEVHNEIVVRSNSDADELKIPIQGEVVAQTSCESTNPCLSGAYDAERKGCVYENLRGSCDDKIPCTIDDKCISGVCVGLPSKKPACKESVCDPEFCDAAPVPAAYLDKKGVLKKNWRKIHARF